MTAYERQILETGACCDEEIAALEAEDTGIPSSVMADSRLHEILHNPCAEGSDGG